MIHKLLAGKGRMKKGVSLLLCLALLGSSVISTNVSAAEVDTDATVEAETAETVAVEETGIDETTGETTGDESPDESTGTGTADEPASVGEEISSTEEQNKTVSENGETPAAEESTAETTEEVTANDEMPAVTLEDSADGVSVIVNASEGAFAENVTMKVSAVDVDAFADAVVADCVASDGGTYTVYDAAAVEISFYDVNGTEVQPETEVEVTLGNLDLNTGDNDLTKYAIIYHMNDDGTMEYIAGGNPGESSYTFSASSFSAYGLIIASVEYDVEAIPNGPGGESSTNYGSSPYSEHIDVRLVTGAYTFTQTVDTSTVQSIKISKVWSDSNSVDHSGDSVSVHLVNSSGEAVSDSVTLDSSNSWTSTLSDLDLQEGTYYVTEDSVTGYTSAVTNDGKVTVTSSSTSEETYTVNVSSLSITGINSTLTYTHNGSTYTITGYSDGSDTESGLSVAEYHFVSNNLNLANGDTITVYVSFTVSYTITDSEGNVIKTVTNKPYTNQKYTETVAAHGDNWSGNWCHAGGYDFYVLPSELLEDIINEDLTEITVTNSPSTVDIPVTKVWEDDDNAGNTRPESITVSLYANGEATGQSLTLSDDNNWSGTFENLAEYDTSDGATNASKIDYTVQENDVSNYTTTITPDTGTGGYTITNTLNTMDITVTKIVTGNMGDQTKEFTITVDGHELSLSHNESGTVTGLTIGSTVILTETGLEGTGYETPVVEYNGQTITANSDGSYSITLVSGATQITVTNKKNATPDTGINLDSSPYIAILFGVALLGTATLLRRRRRLL